MSEVAGKDITELIAAGREKLASVPSGGGAVAVSAAPSGGAAAGGAAAAPEAKEEKKVEEKEESDDVSFKTSAGLVLNNSLAMIYSCFFDFVFLALQDMGFSLFD